MTKTYAETIGPKKFFSLTSIKFVYAIYEKTCVKIIFDRQHAITSSINKTTIGMRIAEIGDLTDIHGAGKRIRNAVTCPTLYFIAVRSRSRLISLVQVL